MRAANIILALRNRFSRSRTDNFFGSSARYERKLDGADTIISPTSNESGAPCAAAATPVIRATAIYTQHNTAIYVRAM